MFNKVLAPFAGTLRKNLMLDADGAVVRAGQAIFEIDPDESIVEESQEVLAGRRQRVTVAAMGG